MGVFLLFFKKPPFGGIGLLFTDTLQKVFKPCRYAKILCYLLLLSVGLFAPGIILLHR